MIWCKREHHLVACFVDSEPLDRMTDSSIVDIVIVFVLCLTTILFCLLLIVRSKSIAKIHQLVQVLYYSTIAIVFLKIKDVDA
ncbi:hypothetical protein AtEden1_Chr5g0132711 [Arabidopsis thaliana]